MKKFVISLGASALSLIAAGSASAASINFDGAAAPCTFASQVPLTTQYAGQGVTFSGFGSALPAEVLDQCSSFGLNARSGTNFVAVNANLGIQGFTMTFAGGASNFSMYFGDNTAGTFLANFYDANAVLLQSVVASSAAGAYTQIARAGNFNSVSITSPFPTWVADDLSFDRAVAGVPEPATWAMMLLGFGAIGGALRRRRNTAVRVTYA